MATTSNQPDIRLFLESLPVDKGVKADAWDAFYGASNPEDFRNRFEKLSIPREAKANLWDLRFGGVQVENIKPAALPPTVAPATVPSPAQAAAPAGPLPYAPVVGGPPVPAPRIPGMPVGFTPPGVVMPTPRTPEAGVPEALGLTTGVVAPRGTPEQRAAAAAEAANRAARVQAGIMQGPGLIVRETVPEPTSLAGKAAKRTAESVASLLSPANVALAGGIGAGTRVAVAAARAPALAQVIGPKAAEVVRRGIPAGVSAGVMTTAAKSVADEGAQAVEAIRQGDTEKAIEHAVPAVVSGIIAAGAGSHAASQKFIPSEVVGRVREAMAEAGKKVKEAIPRKPEVLPPEEAPPAQPPERVPPTVEVKPEAEAPPRPKRPKPAPTAPPPVAGPPVAAPAEPVVAAPTLPPTPAAPPAAPQVEILKPAAPAETRLPRELAGAKPRYSYANKQFELQFESDLDRAAYITAQTNRSKRDADYLAFAQRQTGLSEDEVRSMGADIRARIKGMAKDAEPGTLTIPRSAPEAPRKEVTGEKREPTEAGPPTAIQPSGPPQPAPPPAPEIVSRATGQQDITTGWLNIPLDERGREVARNLAERTAAKGGFDAVFSSDSRRASETAQPIAAESDTPLTTTPSLRAINLVGQEGRTSEETKPVVRAMIEHPDEKAPGGGESFNDFRTRTLSFVQRVMANQEKAPNRRVALVTHSRDLELIEGWLNKGAPADLSIDPGPMLEGKIPPGGVVRLAPGEGGRWGLEPVDVSTPDRLPPGVYLARHGATPWDKQGGPPAAAPEALPPRAAATPVEKPPETVEIPPATTMAGPPAATPQVQGLPLVRHEQPGVEISADRPHGAYFTVKTETPSPHADLGKPNFATATPSNPFIVSSGFRVEHRRFGEFKGGSASAGVTALHDLVGPKEFERLRNATKPDLVRELAARFPGPDYSKYFDSYELLEAYGAQLAREHGYDAIYQPDAKQPEWSEYVALKPSALSPAGGPPVAAPPAQLENIKPEAGPPTLRRSAIEAENDLKRIRAEWQEANQAAEEGEYIDVLTHRHPNLYRSDAQGNIEGPGSDYHVAGQGGNQTWAIEEAQKRHEAALAGLAEAEPQGPLAEQAQPRAEVPGHRRLMDAVRFSLSLGEKIDNPTFDRMAEQAFGGSRAAGAYDPRDAYDALEAAVNRQIIDNGRKVWNEPETAISQLREIESRLPTQTTRTQEQVERQQFSTPPALAYVAAKALNPQPGETVLEPSAGTGSLAAWAKVAGANVETNEIAPRRRALLQELGFEPHQVDAEQLNNLLPDSVQPTAILMNPPFSATGGRVSAHKTEYGLRHVSQALARLAPGGRLVAILGQTTGEGQPGVSEWWKEIRSKYNIRASVGISGKNYVKYGTHFGNRLVIIDKDGPTQDRGQIVKGDYESLEDAYNAIAPVAADRPAIRAERPPRRPEAVVGGPPVAAPVGGIQLGGPRAERPAPEAGGRIEPGGEPVGVRPRVPVQPAPKPEAAPSAPGIRAAKPEPVVGEPRKEPEAQPPAEPPVRGGGAEAAGRLPAVEPATPEELGPFVPYESALKGKAPIHPGNIVETAPMASATAPAIKYQPDLSKTVREGISDVQLEGVSLAGQRFGQMLPGGSRAGMFFGDGTGLGKGREIVGVVDDYWNRGGRKILWTSAGPQLIADAQRDLKDLGLDKKIPMKRINDYPASGAIKLGDGIIFSAYASLSSVSKKANRRRLDQLKDWLGEEPLLIFDESHKAKNALDEKGPIGKEASEQAKAVLELQRELPKARVLYVSATGATEVSNLAYLTRLGLWGPGTSFPGGFNQFHNEIANAGVGAMETVARDIKSSGAYVSRHLSFGPPHAGAKPVEYAETFHQLTPDQVRTYNAGAEIWSQVQQRMQEALHLTNAGPRQKARTVSQFWATQQRFFRQLITAFKVPTVIRQTEDALKNGEAVVISLIGTGEARSVDQITKAVAEGSDLDDLEFSPIEVLDQYLENAFPTQQFTEEEDEDGNVKIVPVLDEKGNPVINKEAEALKQHLRDQLSAIHMPDNTLDQLVNHFGPDKVAEMTGRQRRLVRNPETGKREYKPRNPHGVAMKDVNVYENKQFQSGEKNIAVISAAAGTGISLHASRREQNQRRRRHIVHELGWSADNQIQSFGRTHRSDEMSAPVYDLISSNVAGEKRFSSTIAKRLQSLGALSRGERGAAGAGEIAKYNFESDYGRTALEEFYKEVMAGRDIPGIDDSRKVLRDMGLLKGDKVVEQDLHNLPRFLNRILALDIERQNAVFNHFSDLFDAMVSEAKEKGTFDEGVADIKAQSIKLKGKTLIHTDPGSGAKTEHYELELQQPSYRRPWEGVAQRQRSGRGQFYLNKRSGNPVLAERAAVRTDPKTGEIIQHVQLYRPQNGDIETVSEPDLKERFDAVSSEQVKPVWEQKYETSPETRSREAHIIGGMITPIWQKLRLHEAQHLKVVRLKTDEGQRIVGAMIPPHQIGTVLRNLGVSAEARTPEQIWREVYDRGGTVDLTEGTQLKRAKLAGEPVIEFVTNDPYKFAELRRMGLINERIQYRERFFIPADEKRGPEILGHILNRWPAMAPEKPEGAVLHAGVSGLAAGAKGAAQTTGRDFRNLHELWRNRPRSNYSFAAAQKSMFFRGLQQIKAASQEAYEAGLLFGGSKAQARIHQVGALHAIEKALQGQGVDSRFKGPEAMKHFWAMGTESRLQGARGRWYDMGLAARHGTFSDFKTAYEGDYRKLLSKLEGRGGADEDVLQHADALFAAGNLGELANYVADQFDAAGDRVTTIQEVAQDFDALSEDPGFQAGLEIYKQSIEKPIAEAHAHNEGVFSDALGPLRTYFPLVALKESGAPAHGRPPGKGAPFKKPRNIGNYFTTGLAEGYDISGGPIFQRLEAMRRLNNKAGFLAELHDQGLFVPLGRPADAGPNPTMDFRGITYKAKVVRTSEGRTIIKEGKTIHVPASYGLVPGFVYKDAAPLLDKDPLNWDDNLYQGLLGHLTYLTLIGPTDFVWHMRNYRGVMAANTPFIGSSWMQRNVLSLPVVNWFGVIGTLLNRVRTVNPLDPVNLPILQEMAEAGAIPTRWATETFSKEFAEKHGIKRRFNLGTMLYAPGGLDIHARMLLYEAAKKMNPNVRPGELGEFINQLGNYVFDLESQVERTLKASRVAPFATAGTTMLRNGINTWLGTSKLPILSGGPEPVPGGPLGTQPLPPPGMSKEDQAKWRLSLLLKNGAWGLVGLWAFSHYALRDKWPWRDSISRLFDLPVPDSTRRSAPGQLIWGKGSGQAYIKMDWLNPMATRGARALGLRAFWDTRHAGGTVGQALERASVDSLNAFLHPVVGGPAPRLGAIALTGQEPYVSAFRDRVTGEPTIKFRSAIGDVPPGVPRWTKQAQEAFLNLNPFEQTSAAAFGFGHKAEEEKDLGNRYLRAVINTAVPGLLGSANYNPGAFERSLRREERMIERRERRPRRRAELTGGPPIAAPPEAPMGGPPA